MTESKRSSTSALEQLPDDVFGTVLLYCDFASAFTLSRTTSLALQERSERANLQHVWKEIFRRHNFSPIEESDEDFIGQCQRRRKLLHTLVQNETAKHFYNLPDSSFSFYPLVPKNEDDLDNSRHVHFHEDSFALTSCATSPEMVVLDPFDGSLSVIGDYFETSSSDMISNDSKREEKQILMQADEPFQLDIDPSEFEFAYAGTESKPIVDTGSNVIVGTLVWAGRVIRSVSTKAPFSTELTTWTRLADDSQYANRMACYIPGAFRLVDVDARNLRVFASFPEVHQLRSSSLPQRNQLLVYPLAPYDGETKKNCFTRPIMTIECQHPVSAFSVDATGRSLTVATTAGTIEIWNVKPTSAKRLEIIRFRPAFKASIQARLEYLRNDRERAQDSHNRAANDPCILRRQLERLSQAPIESFYLPKHLSIEQGGFVTSQKDGSSLLLWKQSKLTGEFEIASLITPPLSAKQVPLVKYDGSRLFVFGQDQDGGTVLVYHIACDDLPVGSKRKADTPSGGVYNLTSPPSVGFANHIEHDNLRDLDNSLHMAVNERFIIVNTRAAPTAQGLLVIDLDDANRQ